MLSASAYRLAPAFRIMRRISSMVRADMACGAGIYILGLRRAAAWLLKRGKGLVRRSRERRQAKEASATGP